MKRKTDEQFKKEINDIYGNALEVLGKYKNNKEKILVKYKKCGHSEMKAPIKLLAHQGCGKCKGKSISISKTKTKERYEKDLRDKGIDWIKVVGDYNGVNSKIDVINLKCNHRYEVNAGNLLQGSGCPICHGMKDTSKFIDEIETKYPGKYTIMGEYVNNRTPIKVKHICGYEWEVIPKDLLREERCPECMISKGELFISEYLKENGLKYSQQYKFIDCKDTLPLPFDFAVFQNGEIRLVEFDGIQHFSSRSIFSYEMPKKHDEIKNEYCREHNIPLLRIPYWWIRNDKAKRQLDNFLLNI